MIAGKAYLVQSLIYYKTGGPAQDLGVHTCAIINLDQPKALPVMSSLRSACAGQHGDAAHCDLLPGTEILRDASDDAPKQGPV
jgi:hypothetical protein